MKMNHADSIPTRQSLVVRLKDLGDQESWREFFESYWRLIHAAARKAGLTETEAQDVVQDVMLAAAKKMPGFTYDPAKDSLKGWLLAVTRWKVGDQFRKRESNAKGLGEAALPAPEMRGIPNGDQTARTATIERVPDPNQFEAIWDGEWRENLLRTALDRIKLKVNPAHYEMYYLHVVQGMSPRETARALEVSTASVHLAKHRVGRLVKAEVKRLEEEGN
jgi:RNA polymerase sigma factor (sigma-70 family)